MKIQFLFFNIFLLVSSLSLSLNAQEMVLEGELTPNFIYKLPEPNEWLINLNAYCPDPEAMKHIAQYASEFDLVAVLGTWCEDSRVHFPALLKTLQESGAKFKSFRMIGVDRNKKCSLKDFELFNITHVPTIILLKDGRELARIVETPHESVEKDLAGFIHAK